jgi:hypothetical protein
VIKSTNSVPFVRDIGSVTDVEPVFATVVSAMADPPFY